MSLPHFARTVLALTVGVSGLVATAATAPTPATAQERCVSAGATVSASPWPRQLLAPERVWPLARGAGQRVAVIGTGIADHPQLAGRVVAEVNLASAGSGPPTTADCLGIGTGVAGIVGATPDENAGFRGMAPQAELLSAKVVGDRFPTSLDASVAPQVLAAAVDWSAGQGATVITVTIPTYEDGPALRQAVRRAQERGAVVVAATGELSRAAPAGTTPYPAAYDGVLGVAGIARNGMVTRVSRPTQVDLVAPGYELVTTYPGGGHGLASGSAFAAGYVAGTVALVRAYRPELSAAEAVTRLLATAAPAPEGTGSASYGHGIVDPHQVVTAGIVAGDPAKLPAMQPVGLSAAEQARADAERRSDGLALGIAAGGAAAAVVLTAVVVFGPLGRRRRWRSGLAVEPYDRPEDDLPEPPAELFGDRPNGTP